MNILNFPVYDADHHLYEPEDAFQRHLPREFQEDFYFVERNGRKKLVVNGAVSGYLPNPTFEVVARPGSHERWMRADNPEGLSIREITGKGIRTPAEFRDDSDGRLTLLDQQGLHAALVLPTLASIIEARLDSRPETILALFRSLNTWMDEEWGFAKRDRLFAVPFISLVDVDKAVEEVEFVLKRGARVVGLRPSPVPGPAGTRSFGYPEFDPFWARVAEAGIFVAIHSSVTRYAEMLDWWSGGPQEFQPFERSDTLKAVIDYPGRGISDSIAALICHGVFDRHPTLKVASLENGATWVQPLVARLGRAYGQMPQEFREDPRDTFTRHVFVAPYYEDDVDKLRQFVPVERLLFGSDFPHAEGVAEPLSYLEEFKNYKPDEIERVFSTNLKGLLEGKPL